MNTPVGMSRGGVKVTLAGVDISDYISEASIDIKDTLGQGPGSGSGASPRASTFSLLSSLGPAASAVGAGTNVTTPQLVRNGELIIYDSNGKKIFGGYLTKITDQTDYTQPYTLLEGVDYYQTFSRTIVNEIYSGKTDVEIITDLLKKYAPNISIKRMPLVGSMKFSTKNYNNTTLLDAINDVVDSTGYQAWVDADRQFEYVNPGTNQTAPFSLSDSPNFRNSFQVGIDSYEIDDTATINRVYFYGGKKLSKDFDQDISTQANGTNDTFLLAWDSPHPANDGDFHVKVNGTELVVGLASNNDQLKSQGGLCDVILDVDAHNLTFNVAPAAGATVTCKYRYEIPLKVVLPDMQSVAYFGEYLDGTLTDDTVVDPLIAVQRSKILLLEQAYGLKTLKLRCWRAGLKSGMIMRIDHNVRGIHESFIIQEVDYVPKGAGFFEYQVTLGAWNWSMVDVFNHLIRSAQATDTTSAEETTIIDDREQSDNLSASWSWVSEEKPHGGYCIHAAPLSDGHDAYCGFFSLGGVTPRSYSDSVELDNPFAWWRFGESSGTTANDSSGNGYNGTIAASGVTLGQPGSLFGDSNTAFKFSGNAGASVTPPPTLNTALAGKTALTVEAWFKPISFTSGGDILLVANAWDGASDGFMLFARPSDNSVWFGVSTGSAQTFASYSLPAAWDTNKWYHLVGVWDGSNIKVYANATSGSSSVLTGSLVAGENAITIGFNTDNSGDYGTYYHDEVAIYTNALTASRITAHYNMGTLGHE